MKNLSKKININDWKPKNNSDKLDNLIAEGMICPTFLEESNKNFSLKTELEKRELIKKDRAQKKKMLLELIKNFPHKKHLLHPELNFYIVKAPVGQFVEWAKNKDIGNILLLSVKNAVDIAKLNEKEWLQTKKIDLFKIKLTRKTALTKQEKKDKVKSTQIEVWVVKAKSYKIARNKIQKYFNEYYSNEFSGQILDRSS